MFWSMLYLFESLSNEMRAAVFVVLGGCVGTGLVKVIVRLADGQPWRPPCATSSLKPRNYIARLSPKRLSFNGNPS